MKHEYSLWKIVAVAAVALAIGGAAPWWWMKTFRSNLPPYMDDMEYGVYFQGSDFKDPRADEATTEESCRKACLENSRCQAISFVKRPWGGGECRLKDSVPRRYRGAGAVSAVKINFF